VIHPDIRRVPADLAERKHVMTAETARAAQVPPGRYRFRQAARMEWIKLRTLRSVRWSLLIALAGMIGIGIAAGFNTRNPRGDVTTTSWPVARWGRWCSPCSACW
jgi:hypothetical protein